jgi:hypothetical protein
MSLKSDVTKFVSVMEKIGSGAEKTLVVASHYFVPVATLVSLLFPAEGEAALGAAVTADLIQSAVAEVEQKAKALPAGLTGPQKLADVLHLVEAAVVSILASEKLAVNSQEVTNLVNAVVAILNVVPAAA